MDDGRNGQVGDADLYRAILSRRSVRRYDRRALEPEMLARVADVVARVEPLVPQNRFEVLRRDVSRSENLVAILGGYGRLVSPPHYLVPWVVGAEHPLVDLGCRIEQIAVHLAEFGLGSCFVGSLGREPEVRARFGLSEDARVAAFLIFGWPSKALGGRAVNSLLRLATGATNRLPLDRLFFRGSFDSPGLPPPQLVPVLEAARNAPSAVDAQPWRFLWRDDRLHLFVKRRNPRYGGGIREDYRLHDGGACMANVALALEALGMDGRWVLYEGTEQEIPDHPPELQPLAALPMGSHDLP